MKPFKRTERKYGRNELCPCRSGRKVKHCCGLLTALQEKEIREYILKEKENGPDNDNQSTSENGQGIDSEPLQDTADGSVPDGN